MSHHVRDPIPDLVDVFAIRTDHLALFDVNLTGAIITKFSLNLSFVVEDQTKGH